MVTRGSPDGHEGVCGASPGGWPGVRQGSPGVSGGSPLTRGSVRDLPRGHQGVIGILSYDHINYK